MICDLWFVITSLEKKVVKTGISPLTKMMPKLVFLNSYRHNFWMYMYMYMSWPASLIGNLLCRGVNETYMTWHDMTSDLEFKHWPLEFILVVNISIIILKISVTVRGTALYEAMHRAIEMQMKRICLRNFSATFVYTICWMCWIYLIHFEILLWNVFLYISKLCNWSPSMKHQAIFFLEELKAL